MAGVAYPEVVPGRTEDGLVVRDVEAKPGPVGVKAREALVRRLVDSAEQFLRLLEMLPLRLEVLRIPTKLNNTLLSGCDCIF